MSDRLHRIRELQAGGFDVVRIESGSGRMEVSLQNELMMITMVLGREDARAILYGEGRRTVRAPRTLVRP